MTLNGSLLVGVLGRVPDPVEYQDIVRAAYALGLCECGHGEFLHGRTVGTRCLYCECQHFSQAELPCDIGVILKLAAAGWKP